MNISLLPEPEKAIPFKIISKVQRNWNGLKSNKELSIVALLFLILNDMYVISTTNSFRISGIYKHLETFAIGQSQSLGV